MDEHLRLPGRACAVRVLLASAAAFPAGIREIKDASAEAREALAAAAQHPEDAAIASTDVWKRR